MNRFYGFLAAVFCITALSINAQKVFTFEDLQVLPDSFISPKNLAGGFGDSLVFFHSKWDTSFGGYWSHGFAPSTKKDKVTPGFGNQYSAITGSGYNSNTYAISYGESGIKLKGKAAGKVVNGFYITNTTYAYFSMKDGDAFGKKFGGPTGNDPDFFYLTVKGFLNGVKKNDSVNFYLADFRFSDNTKDYILSEWAWVNLAPLGNVDSLSFQLHSSDVGQFGMNTPAYFAMDNFTFNDGTSLVENASLYHAKIYPNPLKMGSNLHIELPEPSHLLIRIISLSGEVVKEEAAPKTDRITIETAGLTPGMYFAHLLVNGQVMNIKFCIR
jgi:hypothetical protein